MKKLTREAYEAAIEEMFAVDADKVKVEEIAKRLGVGGRTLQRHIAQSGTTFRGLVKDAKKRIAVEKLRSGARIEEFSCWGFPKEVRSVARFAGGSVPRFRHTEDS